VPGEDIKLLLFFDGISNLDTAEEFSIVEPVTDVRTELFDNVDNDDIGIHDDWIKVEYNILEGLMILLEILEEKCTEGIIFSLYK